MDKLKMQSPNLVDANIDKIAALFPNCITENRDENGVVRRVVDFDQLRQELSASLVEGPQERYTLNWPGKNEAILTANAPIAKTLRPCEEESVDFENTKNIFIEGDNLDALKLLQETYLNKVKMIYIDPPYNTGNDFVYEDDFAEDTESFLQRSNQKDAHGNRLVANTEANGRFHSDWLSMIYPRLKLARNMLKAEGIIFISIDDSEFYNLKKLCDEILGEDNLVGSFVWLSKKGGGSDNNKVVTDQEYVLCYVKESITDSYLTKIEIQPEPLDCEDEYGKYRKGRELNKWGANSRREDRPTMYFPIPGPENTAVYPIRNDGTEGCWRWGKKNMMDAVANNNVAFVKRDDGTYIAYEKIRTEEPRLKPHRTFLNDCGATADGSKLIKNIFDDLKIFDFPKPLTLLKTLLNIGSTSKEDIVFDFFSGSATTAHAVMQLNAEDNGNRKFIMVQLPEVCDEKTEAFKAGYKTIAEIGKERIRRAGKKIKEENPLTTQNLDIGFRVFKVDTSNMKEVYYTPDELIQGNLDLFKNHIKPDRRPEDLLFQVFIDWGLDLSLPIAKETIDGKTVFLVDTNVLIACFDSGINEELVKKLATHKPLRVVFRDDAFGSDSVKINVEQIFKLLSPATEVKSI